MDSTPETAAVRDIRRLLLLILVLGLVGTGSDLLLIAHYEGEWQLPPLVLIALALPIVVWLTLRTRPGWLTIVLLRVTMVLFMCVGALGVLLHYNGNREFQKEIDPSLSGLPLFVKVMTAKAPPALAPGVMVQLGLLGLVYTYRHPALTAPDRPRQPTSSGA